MKQVYLYIFICFFFFSKNFSQNTSEIKRHKDNNVCGVIDSLIEEGYKQTGKDIFYAVKIAKQASGLETNCVDKKLSLKSNRLLGACYNILGEYDSSILFIEKAINVSKELNDNKNFIGLSCLQSNNFVKKGHLDSSFFYMNNVENHIKETNYKYDDIFIYYKLQKITYFESMLLYSNALDEALLTHSIIDSLNLKKFAPLIYSSEGLIYSKIGNHKKAIEIYKKSLIGFDSLDGDKAVIYTNIAENYFNLGEMEKAQNYYTKAEKLYQKINNPNKIVTSRLNYADFLLLINRNNEASTILNTIDTTFLSELDKARFFILLGKLNDGRKSIFFLEKGIDLCEKLNQITLISESLIILSEKYSEKHKYKNALTTYKKAILYKDSILNKEKNLKIQSVILKNIVQKQKKIHTTKIKEEKEKRATLFNQLIILVLSLLVILISIVFLIIWLKKNNNIAQLKLDNYRIEQDKLKAINLYKEKENRELAINLVERNNLIQNLSENIRNVENLSEIDKNKIIHSLNSFRGNNLIIDKLSQKISRDFLEKLEIKYPNISKKDKRLITLTQLNLTNKEIANLLFIEEKSVEMAKNRLRKKMNLPLGHNFKSL